MSQESMTERGTLRLYGTSGCHLCEDARTVVREALGETVMVEEIDIARDDALLDRYGARIPVLAKEESTDELDWPFGVAELVAWAGRHRDQRYRSGAADRPRRRDSVVAAEDPEQLQ